MAEQKEVKFSEDELALQACRETFDIAQAELTDGRKKDADITKLATMGGESAKKCPSLKKYGQGIKQAAKLNDVCWYPGAGGGEFMCLAAQDGKVLVYNCKSADAFYFQALNTWLNVCEFNPSGTHLTVGGLDNTITMFKLPDLGAGEAQKEEKEEPKGWKKEFMKHNGPIYSIKWLSDDQIISGSGDGVVMLWDANSTANLVKEPTSTFKGQGGDATCLEVWDDRNVFLCSSEDNFTRMYDTRVSTATNSAVVATYCGHSASVSKISKMKTGQAFASASDDGTARVWDMRTMREIARFGDLMEEDEDVDKMTAVEFSKSGRHIFVGHGVDMDTTCVPGIKVYDVLGGNDQDPLSLSHHRDGQVKQLALSKDGNVLASCSSEEDGSYNFAMWA